MLNNQNINSNNLNKIKQKKLKLDYENVGSIKNNCITVVGKDKKLMDMEIIYKSSKAEIDKKWQKKNDKLNMMISSKIEVKQLNPLRTKVLKSKGNDDD